MDNVINVNDLPKRKHGNKYVIDWVNLKQTKVRFKYKEYEGFLIVSFLKRKNNGLVLEVAYNNRKIEMYSSNFLKGKIGVLIGKFNKEHKYQVGETVNNVTILKQMRKRDSRNNKILCYKVKCNVTGKIFCQTQNNMAYGYGSPYASGHKVWEGNWLYNEKHLLPLIKNPEDAKKISVGSDRKILCVCPKCKNEKYMIARNLFLYGITCHYCSPYLSYPEKFIMAYLEIMNIRYIYQFKIGETRRYIDFYLPDKNIAIEVQGEQHYTPNINSIWLNAYENSVISDEFKRKYCEEFNIKLIEIDARKSYFQYLVNSIKQSSLPNLPRNKEKLILKKIHQRRFNNNELNILKEYKSGKSSNSIAKKYGVSVKHVTNIAKKYNVYKNRDRRIKIRCKNTGKVYNSIAEASREFNISATSISMVCNNKRNHNIGPNGEKIYWEKINESI